MNKKYIWLSYDLSINGDYEGLYRWLDDNDAKECGDSFAYFPFSYNGTDFVESLKKDLKDNVEINEKKDRFYVIFKNEDDKYIGRFIFGNRKASPWQGMGKNNHDEEDKEEP